MLDHVATGNGTIQNSNNFDVSALLYNQMLFYLDNIIHSHPFLKNTTKYQISPIAPT